MIKYYAVQMGDRQFVVPTDDSRSVDEFVCARADVEGVQIVPSYELREIDHEEFRKLRYGKSEFLPDPEWTCVANLGDCHPLDYGGLLVFVDKTGKHRPRIEVIVPDDEDESRLTIYRKDLDPHTYLDGVLSANEFHPNHPEWYGKPDKIKSVCSTGGMEQDEFIALICSTNPCEVARGYEVIASTWGWSEFDNYPLETRYRETKKRYREAFEQLKAIGGHI